MFKKFRRWFEQCFNDPLRLNEEQFIGLLMEMLGTREYDHKEAIDVFKKLGFEERRNVKGTFYIRPTIDFYIDAERKRVPLNRLLFLFWRKN